MCNFGLSKFTNWKYVDIEIIHKRSVNGHFNIEICLKCIINFTLANVFNFFCLQFDMWRIYSVGHYYSQFIWQSIGQTCPLFLSKLIVLLWSEVKSQIWNTSKKICFLTFGQERVIKFDCDSFQTNCRQFYLTIIIKIFLKQYQLKWMQYELWYLIRVEIFIDAQTHLKSKEQDAIMQ